MTCPQPKTIKMVIKRFLKRWLSGLGKGAHFTIPQTICNSAEDMTKTKDEITKKLDLAIFNNDVKKFTEIFSDEYANVRSEFGTPLLHLAAGGGCEEVVLILLRAGADVNNLDEDEDECMDTALFWSLSNAHNRISKILIEYNTNLNVIDTYGNQVLWTAVANSNFRDPDRNIDRSILNDLLERGADPHHKNNVNKSPYDVIKMYNEKELLDIFEPYI